MFPGNIANILVVEELERVEELRNFNIERRLRREDSDPFSLENANFKQTFRLTKDMAQYVLNRILPLIDLVNNNVSIPAHLKFFAALEFYATGSYQRSIGESFNISASQQMVSQAITLVTNAIVNLMAEEWIVFPNTNEQRNSIKAKFMEKARFPGVIGAIDCTHVAILAPADEEHNYVNRKGYHSKNVQLICDYAMKILNVNAQYAGATHDAFIWRRSAIQGILQRNYEEGDHTSWLLGDSGYPQQPWLMTPVRNPLPGTPEANYNDAHARARNCVERCFGVLKGRFRCLLKERVLRYTPEKVGAIFYACSILHNVCLNGNLEVDFDVPAPDNDNIVDNIPMQIADARRTLINNYFQN